MDFLLKKSGGLFEKKYELLLNGSVCCILSFDDWKYADFLIDSIRYVIRSDDKARWMLEQNGINVACCTRHATGPQLEFTINFDDRSWCFKPNRKKLVLTHDIWEEKLKIGRIRPFIKFWWLEIGATFKQEPRFELVGFAVWLIGIHSVGFAGKLIAGRAEIGL